MRNSKYTPGPWTAHATGHARSGKPEYEIHWSADGECVAEIVHGEADAKLISAAPDLLEALKYALSYQPKDDSCDPWASDARAAIAKAKGGAA